MTMITVAETDLFGRKSAQLLTEGERMELIAYLSLFPQAGVLIQGTGGVRKLRWGLQGRGKSGGVRVIYYFHNDSMPLYLLTLFSKNEKANLSHAEKQMLAKLTRQLVQHLQTGSTGKRR